MRDECGLMVHKFHRGFTAAEKTELWDRWKRGESLKAIGRAFGKQSSSIYFLVAPHGGIRPARPRTGGPKKWQAVRSVAYVLRRLSEGAQEATAHPLATHRSALYAASWGPVQQVHRKKLECGNDERSD
jgi:hypothetical protein